MSHRGLAELLEELGRAGELERIETPIEPALELAQVAREAAAKTTAALLFADVRGHQMPVVSGLLGSEARVCRALDVESLMEAAGRVERLLKTAEPEGWLQRLRIGGSAGPLADVAPRQVRSGACQQIVRLGGDVDLAALPLVDVPDKTGTGTSHPLSGSSSLNPEASSLKPEAFSWLYDAMILTAEPDTHRPLACRADLARIDRNRLAIVWAAHEEPPRLLAEYRRRGGPMPLAVVVGGEPACWLAAGPTSPPLADPLALAGVLRGRAIDAVACRTIDLQVPAEADFILEGHLDPADPPVTAGPRVGPMGQLLGPTAAVVLSVTAITQRATPVWAAMLPGLPSGEAAVADRAMARVMLPIARAMVPELVDLDLPIFGAARHWAVLSIRKDYPGQVRRVAAMAWGLRQLLAAKVLVIVDQEVDVRDSEQVFAAVAAHMDPASDMFADQGPLGHRMVLDATEKAQM